MSQHDFNIANQSFPNTRSDINNALVALATNSSGAAAPSTTQSFMNWADSGNDIMKLRNEANSDWISLYKTDGVQQYASGSAATLPAFSKADDVDTGLYFPSANNVALATGGTGRLYVDSNGNVGIATSPSISGDGFIFYPTGSSSSPYLVINKSESTSSFAIGFKHNGVTKGSITYTSSATSYNTTSDYRLKENIKPIEDGLSRLMQLKPNRFNFINNKDTVDGFLAHEAAEVVPESVTGQKDDIDEEGNPEYQGIDQSKLVPLLVAAVQDLKKEIDKLKNKK